MVFGPEITFQKWSVVLRCGSLSSAVLAKQITPQIVTCLFRGGYIQCVFPRKTALIPEERIDSMLLSPPEQGHVNEAEQMGMGAAVSPESKEAFVYVPVISQRREVTLVALKRRKRR